MPSLKEIKENRKNLNEAFSALANFMLFQQNFDRASLQNASGIEDDNDYIQFMHTCRAMLIADVFSCLKTRHDQSKK